MPLPSSPSSAHKPSVGEFFRGKSVFLTGGTGFVGKALMEKLLRSCPGLEKLYCMVRQSKGRTVDERLTSLLQESCFERIRLENPDLLNKVVAIEGDMEAEAGLGISQENLVTLKKNVHIVLHSAATINFKEHIRKAVQINLIGTEQVLSLCRSMPRMEAFVYVSTAYANIDHARIEERIYSEDTATSPRQLIDLVRSSDDVTLASLTPKLVGNLENTYIFTKRLTEILVTKEAGDLPYCIVRPSIVTPSLLEPEPGWIDHIDGPFGVAIAAGTGLLRTACCRATGRLDLIPVDLCVNRIIAAAWYTGVHQAELRSSAESDRAPLIFNLITGAGNPITWQGLIDKGLKYMVKFPPGEVFRKPELTLTASHNVHKMRSLYQHYLPAVLVDGVCVLLRMKPLLMRIYRTMDKIANNYRFAMQNDWEWADGNLLKLPRAMNDEDNKVFFTDDTVIDWQKYCENSCAGLNKYIQAQKARKAFNPPNLDKGMKYLKVIVVALVTLVLLWLFWWTF